MPVSEILDRIQKEFKFIKDLEKAITDIVMRDLTTLGRYRVNVENGRLVIYVAVPGASKEDIDVVVYENKVVVKANSKYLGRIEYTIDIPPVRPETAKARLDNGVLILTIERTEKPVKVTVT